MRLKRWYRNLLIAWMAAAPLTLILGWGFAGAAPWRGLPVMFESENVDLVSMALTLFGWTALLAPFLLLPFGIGKKATR